MNPNVATTDDVTPAEALKAGWTLPANWYTDPAIYDMELERIFERNWQYVGPVDWVAQPGDYFTCQVANIPAVVARDKQGQLNAFVNVCRHRANPPVADGRGNRTTFQCAYHAWTYDLDGSLRAAPRCERESHFDKSQLGLLPLKVDTWGPFVFVTRDLGAPPVLEALDDLPDRLAEDLEGTDLSTLKFRSRWSAEAKVNWKVSLENFLECLHCAPSHPAYCQLMNVDPDAVSLDIQDTYSVFSVPVRESAGWDGTTGRYDARGMLRHQTGRYIWPNLTLPNFPGPPNLHWLVFAPLSPETSFTFCDYYYSDEWDDENIQRFEDFNNEVNEEDVALVEGVQRGLRSGAVPYGQLLMDSEQQISFFQQLVYRELTGESV